MLLIEDADEDAFFLERAAKQLGFPGTLTRVTSQQEALAYLQHEHPYQNAAKHPVPDLIISDSGVGRGNAMDLIDRARSLPGLNSVPFIVYSTLISDQTCERARVLGAVECLTKAATLPDLVTQLKRILEFLPNNCHWWKW